jgi:hypothetical protein
MFDSFYKLGAAKATQDLGGILSAGIDNPTMAPPASRYTKTAVERVIAKLAKETKKRRVPPPIYTPTKGTKFKAMVGRLKKKKTSKRR